MFGQGRISGLGGPSYHGHDHITSGGIEEIVGLRVSEATKIPLEGMGDGSPDFFQGRALDPEDDSWDVSALSFLSFGGTVVQGPRFNVGTKLVEGTYPRESG